MRCAVAGGRAIGRPACNAGRASMMIGLTGWHPLLEPGMLGLGRWTLLGLLQVVLVLVQSAAAGASPSHPSQKALQRSPQARGGH